MNVRLTIEGASVTEVMSHLATEFAIKCWAENDDGPETPQTQTEPEAPAPEPPKEEPKPEPKKEEPKKEEPKKETPALTLAEVRPRMNRYGEVLGRDIIRGIIKHYGGERLTDIDPKHYEAMLAEAEQAVKNKEE